MSPFHALPLAALLAAPGGSPPSPAAPLSAAREAPLTRHLAAERPTVFVFLKPSSTLERGFLQELRQQAGAKVGFREIPLKSGTEPLAKQYGIVETPTALVYDRRGRFVGRSSSAAAITGMVRQAAGVMRIDWAEPGDPRYDEVEQILGRQPKNGIMHTFSLRPEWLRLIQTLHGKAHRPDTALDRRTKEMIATYVSALNRCKF
ncbi:MAG: carboxymuconolactone decarboxylase family protein [Armatimonadota bacterium]